MQKYAKTYYVNLPTFMQESDSVRVSKIKVLLSHLTATKYVDILREQAKKTSQHNISYCNFYAHFIKLHK